MTFQHQASKRLRAALLLAMCISLRLMSQSNDVSVEEIPPLRPLRAEMPPTFGEQYGVWIALAGLLLLVIVAGIIWSGIGSFYTFFITSMVAVGVLVYFLLKIRPDKPANFFG